MELECAHFLQEHGAPSARRTQQYAGTGGTSDVSADELPHFHQEVKATKALTLTEGKLKKWLKQVNTDCPEGKHWVIWHKANDCAFVCIIPPCHFNELKTSKYVLDFYLENSSISPFLELAQMYKEKRMQKALTPWLEDSGAPVIGFEVDRQLLLALSAKEWVKWALEWEKKQ